MDTFDVGLFCTFNGPGAVSIGLTEKKSTGKVFLYINYLKPTGQVMHQQV
jgi:hypothetical protein